MYKKPLKTTKKHNKYIISQNRGPAPIKKLMKLPYIIYGIFILKHIARQNARQFDRHFNFYFKSGAVPFLILLD